MDIRFAEQSDLDRIMDLVNRAFRVESFFIDGDRLDRERLRGYFEKGRFLLAEDNGALAGCVYVELHSDHSYLGLLSVDPDRQKTGLGRRLTAAAEEFAREMGSHRMELTVVHLRTELPPFYEKLGYKVIGTEPIRKEMESRVTQPCHFIRMAKPLGGA
ncbi:MAG TPA: GNAT family N-acetyltransferase [Acidobacteriaceae bacterium]|jgi:N-acetylglutamate synthase-like GNAT family acetyltransferase|nr:GNAT family N-acetyltransferase [Acidobacteriaceae bacterium]